MADNRPSLDRMMKEEGSRAVHEEFMAAEGGQLPTLETRLGRARSASARAWLRHLTAALSECWADAPEGLPGDMQRWATGHAERIEALELEEEAALEKRGRSGDPEADRRRVALTAHMRFFAEALGDVADPPGLTGPQLSRAVADAAHERAGRLDEVEAEARAAWAEGTAEPAEQTMSRTATPDPEHLRVIEAAAVWAHVRLLAEELGGRLDGPPPEDSAPAA